LAFDLDLGPFDPLDCDLAAPWDGPRPKALLDLALKIEGPFRTAGDAVERLEALALALVAGTLKAKKSWARTRQVLDQVNGELRANLLRSGPSERVGAMAALAGRFVAPGPSGAPTRGRPEVLPTGRNFYSVDVRAVPTTSAWTLGWKSAALLLARHATVTMCHTRTRDLAAHTRRADVLCVAAGRARMITGDMVKEGAWVLDVGMNRLPTGQRAGDVDFASAEPVAGAITPVPGGVGPMTVAMLLKNTLAATERQLAAR
jgi:hypothetical protein